MDENKFFRNITLKLCGHLKIEEGLRACIKYLSQYMPADRLYLVERHDYGSGEMAPCAGQYREVRENRKAAAPFRGGQNSDGKEKAGISYWQAPGGICA